jgi:hypothetical protein
MRVTRAQKCLKVFLLAKTETSFFRAKIFFVRVGTKLRCFFFSLKKTDSRGQKKQNTEVILKNNVFFDVRSFLEDEKFIINNILKKKKHESYNDDAKKKCYVIANRFLYIFKQDENRYLVGCVV